MRLESDDADLKAKLAASESDRLQLQDALTSAQMRIDTLTIAAKGREARVTELDDIVHRLKREFSLDLIRELNNAKQLAEYLKAKFKDELIWIEFDNDDNQVFVMTNSEIVYNYSLSKDFCYQNKYAKVLIIYNIESGRSKNLDFIFDPEGNKK